ncbi:hypothetical protein BOX15_Mlig019495g1, partial [Macrostomum lignano]
SPAPSAKPVESVTLQQFANASQASLSLGCRLPGNSSDRVTYVEWQVHGDTVCRLFLQRKPMELDECRSSLHSLGIGINDAGVQLVLAPVLARHEGRYRCLAYEDSDSYELVTNVLVRDKPFKPTRLQHVDVGRDWVRLGWEPPRQQSHLPVDHYEAASWPDLDEPDSRKPPAGVTWQRVRDNNSFLHSHRFSYLSVYTSYCFAVRAVNSIGAGQPAVRCGIRTRGRPPERGAVSARLVSANATRAAFVVAYQPDRLHGRLRQVELLCQLMRYRELNVAFAPEDRQLSALGLRALLPSRAFNDSTELVWLAEDLQPYSQYRLIIKAYNEEYDGPPEVTKFNTTEGLAPSPSLMQETQLQFDTNATLTWNQRRRIPGQLLYYRVRYSPISYPAVQYQLNVSAQHNRVVLTKLQPMSEYRVSLAAVTGLGPGAESNTIVVSTEPSWPSSPRQVQIETGFEAGAVVSWAHSRFTMQIPKSRKSSGIPLEAPARKYPAHLLAFRVSWAFLDPAGPGAASTFGHMETKPLNDMSGCSCSATDWRPRSPSTPCRDQPDRICVLIPWSQLAAGRSPPDDSGVLTRVSFSVRSVGLSQWSAGRRYPGHVSEDCTTDIPAAYIFPKSAASHSTKQPVIVGVIVGGCIMLLAIGIIAFLIWKWLCSHRGYRRPFGTAMETMEFVEHEYNGTRSSGCRPQFRPYSQTEFKPLSIPDFREHVLASHANDNSAFQMEFDSVQQSTHRDWPALHWKQPENLAKNRYTDIYPFDHSRVILFSNSRKKRGDYINANYVDGYHRPKAYIACQGPLPATFDDFWLMVWENKSSVVVMISNFVERGRRKCDQYWPGSGSQTYGHISVRFISQESKAAYCLRKFGIRDTRAKKSVKERLVHHYLYSEWPDYGVPQYPLPVLNFVQKSIRSSDDHGPIVVHCSAGVGRTGTYICIEAQIRQILQQKTVNVRGFLEHIRQQRMRLVQTEEQYVFIHDVLLEFLLCPEREVPRDQLTSYIKGLDEPGPCGCSRLETQYQLCVSEQPSPRDRMAAKKPCNARKNRCILPIDSRRVKLTAEPGVEGSDYINASHLHGYFSMNEYIVTQHPLEETVFDFLKMIWDHNCSVVVSVYTEDSPDEPPLPSIWPTPEDDMREAEHLQLYFRNEEEYPFATRREFLMATKRDDYSLVVSLWTLKRWPELLGQAMDMMKLVGAVSERRAPPAAPLIVMDTYGSSHAGIFCALYSLYHQLQLEHSVDVYSLFKLYHLQRPGMFNSSADLQFIYEVITFHASVNSPSSSLLPQRRDNGGTGGTLGSRGGDRREAQQLPAQEALHMSEQLKQLQQEVEETCGQEKQLAESTVATAVPSGDAAITNGSDSGAAAASMVAAGEPVSFGDVAIVNGSDGVEEARGAANANGAVSLTLPKDA